MNTEKITKALELHNWIITNVISDIDDIEFDPRGPLFREGLDAASEATTYLIEALRG